MDTDTAAVAIPASLARRLNQLAAHRNVSVAQLVDDLLTRAEEADDLEAFFRSPDPATREPWLARWEGIDGLASIPRLTADDRRVFDSAATSACD